MQSSTSSASCGRRGSPWGPSWQAHVRLPRGSRPRAPIGRSPATRMSALGVQASSERRRRRCTCARGRRRAGGAQARARLTIFRPGRVRAGHGFLNLFARLQAWLPVMALARAGAPAGVRRRRRTGRRRADAGHPAAATSRGARRLPLRELVALAGRHAGHERPIVALPDGLGRLQATLLEFAPGPTLMSRDNFDSMAIDNVASGPIAPGLGLPPTPLAAIAPAYLRRGPARFGRERARARR